MTLHLFLSMPLTILYAYCKFTNPQKCNGTNHMNSNIHTSLIFYRTNCKNHHYPPCRFGKGWRVVTVCPHLALPLSLPWPFPLGRARGWSLLALPLERGGDHHLHLPFPLETTRLLPLALPWPFPFRKALGVDTACPTLAPSIGKGQGTASSTSSSGTTFWASHLAKKAPRIFHTSHFFHYQRPSPPTPFWTPLNTHRI